MEQKRSNKKAAVIAAVVLVVLAAAFAAVMLLTRPKTQTGSKSVTVTVTDDKGEAKSYSAKTDAEFLSKLLEEVEGLKVEGHQDTYGFYIDTVNGLTADYNADGAYWAIYVNGEYGMYGADTQPVADGDAFGLTYERYVAAAQ